MKALLYCMLGLSVAACTPRKAVNKTSDELAMLVGTYTNGTSKGIYTFRFNQETGTAIPLSTMELPNPSYLIPSEDGKFVYAVSEMNDSTAALSSFAFDKSTGILRLLNTEPTLGAAPCYVATNGKEALTANYSGGSMSVFPLRKDGTLGPVDTLFIGSATGTDTIRQITAHIHCTVFSPDGKYIFATDFSADRILRFVLHPKDIIPHLSAETTDIAPGSGPRHLTFSPNGKYAYLITELSGKVIAFSYDNGKLEQIQTITADTIAARGSADIHLSPDGKYLYASNRLREDGIAIFAVSPDNGTLAKAGYQPTGIHPRHFNITPNGKYLLAACRDSNTIQIYERNATTGLLKDTHRNITVDKPVCIQFVQ
ncbi:lactonase family protein [Bacteroides helcogenes]|uniref:lactonase family protein n=1 Tax=Bacteroides helcogenes TaxID=290053 RepID=UPI002A90F79A|nr:lactonase family protein [Bacteroides helcogenes]MDY5239276.1 lactonase family protein [Bacteroides helcogenes]